MRFAGVALVAVALAASACAAPEAESRSAAPRATRVPLESYFVAPEATRTVPLVSAPVSTPVPMVLRPPSAGFAAYPLEFLSAEGAAPGRRASASVRTLPGASCWMVYTPPTGTVSGVLALEDPVTASDGGLVSWQWQVALGTPAGFASLDVTCNDLKAREWIWIQLPP